MSYEIDHPRLLPLGDGAWTVEFGDRIDPAVHGRVMGFFESLQAARENSPALAGIIDIVPTFRSLTVHYDPLLGSGAALGEALRQLAGQARGSVVQGRCWSLPACFDDDFAPDLAAVAERHGLSRAAALELFCASEFRVYMIGFMPGFPYMGGLPAQLQTPRLASPRQKVPARSIAVAGEMGAVYPWESPGGWNLLGRTPVSLFVAGEAQPSLLASGDIVRWQPVDRATYDAIAADLHSGRRRRLDFLQPGVPA